MINDIIEPTVNYDFSKLYLGPATTLAGGSYFSRIMYGINKILYIQTPKTLTKQGFIKTGKKIYTDIMLDNNDTVFINWIENLETKCQELIYDKGQNWFENKLEKDDIESAFTSSFKIFKSGKYYLLRVNVKPNIKIFDESDRILTIEDITLDKSLISIIEIQGIKFTSRNFQIEFELKQTMIVSPDPFLDNCFIKKPYKKNNSSLPTPVTEELIPDSFIEDSVNELSQNQAINLELDFDIKQVGINNKEKELKEKELKEQALKEQTLKEQTLKEQTLKEQTLKEQTLKEQELKEKELKEKELNSEDNELKLDIEEIIFEDNEQLKEVDIFDNLENNNCESITLKKPNQVYYELYKKAREKAKEAKKLALNAYFEMKNIKKTYMLDDIDNSESENEFEDLENELEEL